MKKAMSIVFGILFVFGLAACTDFSPDVNGYYVSVDINPSIEFIVDGDDIVESYIFLNEDAEILCADLDFTGMNIDDAVELFIETATEAGYIDPDGEDNAVLITVLGEDGEEERIDQIRERIRERAVRHFARRYINSVVLTEEFTQEDLVQEANELGVSPGKLKLAYAAIAQDDSLVLEELLDLPVKDLLGQVKDLHESSWQEYKNDRLTQMRQRKQEMVQEHRAEIEAYINEHPEMTDEEVDAYIEEYKQAVQDEVQARWQERVQQWNQKREEQNNNNDTTDDTSDDE